VLFNSYPFIFLFLPIAIAGFAFFRRLGRQAQIIWLTFASLFFYAWWDWRYVGLLAGSMLFNFTMGLSVPGRRGALAFAIAVNLAILGFFKYWGFLTANISAAFGVDLPASNVTLPLGISFYTFTQIAFLVDCYRNEANERRLVNYGLFVTYFPHLIAGPLFHHKQMMPQFADRARGALNVDNIALGATMFVIGLFKKVIIAEGAAHYADRVFEASHATMVVAWLGVLAYALQIYFDFSGYCDMAIGLSRMFNINIPINFNSPYKAAGIIEFWQRWNMTLSRFLRDYLYIPLGGNRRGEPRRYVNLMVTMLLGGLWHGASWNFVVWGGLHGVYLVINHGWRALRGDVSPTRFGSILSVLLTFVCVMIAWVFFRAESLESAFDVLRAMAGANGLISPDWAIEIGGAATRGHLALAQTAVVLAAVWLLPNSQEIVGLVEQSWLGWRPSLPWAVAFASLAAWCFGQMGEPTRFLYYQF
jgi:alginate O-acetyltransferase complex protein AlgI